MKALTLYPQHADAVARGVKWIENRSWVTTYRGPLAIHAGVGGPKADLAAWPHGCFVAVVDLVAIYHLPDLYRMPADRLLQDCGLTPEQIIRHGYTLGPQCWVLQNVRQVFPKIKATGKQGLWEVDPVALQYLAP